MTLMALLFFIKNSENVRSFPIKVLLTTLNVEDDFPNLVVFWAFSTCGELIECYKLEDSKLSLEMSNIPPKVVADPNFI